MAEQPLPEWKSYDHGRALVVQPQGRLDHGMSASFEHALQTQSKIAIERRRHMIIDLSGVTFVSSIILKAIRSQKEAFAKSDLEIALCRPTPVVREILQIAQFQFVAAWHDNANDAEAAFSTS